MKLKRIEAVSYTHLDVYKRQDILAFQEGARNLLIDSSCFRAHLLRFHWPFRSWPRRAFKTCCQLITER